MNKGNEIAMYTLKKINILQNDTPLSKATLAKLRRAIGKDISYSVDTFDIVFNDMPLTLSDNSGELNEAEVAIFYVLTLYATHQQGHNWSANNSDLLFAEAMKKLISPLKGNEEAIVRKFNAIITSNDLTELSVHLRGIIQLMRSSDVPISFDYPTFAKDLYYYQFPDGRRNVRIRWGKQFYRNNVKENNEESDSE